jgi:hypothetical protein
MHLPEGTRRLINRTTISIRDDRSLTPKTASGKKDPNIEDSNEDRTERD